MMPFFSKTAQDACSIRIFSKLLHKIAYLIRYLVFFEDQVI